MEKKEITYKGEHFQFTSWNDVAILEHVESGYLGITHAASKNGKEFYDWIRLKKTERFLRFVGEDMKLEIGPENYVFTEPQIYGSVKSLLFRVNINGNDLTEFGSIQGVYVHPNIFHSICEWISPEYEYKVSRLMNQINEEAKLKQQTFDEILAQKEKEIEELRKEIEELKTIQTSTNSKVVHEHEIFETTWNGITVWIDKKTGFYYGEKLCSDNGKRFRDLRRLSDYKAMLEAVSAGAQICAPEIDVIFPEMPSGYQGHWIHPLLVNYVAEWADKKYAVKVAMLMNQINEEAKLKQQTFDEILAQKEKEIEELKEKYRISNTPINRGIQTGSLYAQPVSSTSFHLRWSKEPILESRIPNLKHVEVYNGDDIRKMVVRQLKLEKKIKSENFGSKAKLVVKNEDLEYVFDLINKASKAETSEISAEKRDKYLNDKLAEYKNRRQTSMMKGFIFETETVLKRKDYIPWALLPDEIIGNYGEQRRDCGIDAVVLNPDNSFKEIIQIKHHLNTYIRENEIEAFIKKTTQFRYDGCAKRLILHGCKYGKKFEKYITDRGIIIENI